MIDRVNLSFPCFQYRTQEPDSWKKIKSEKCGASILHGQKKKKKKARLFRLNNLLAWHLNQSMRNVSIKKNAGYFSVSPSLRLSFSHSFIY